MRALLAAGILLCGLLVVSAAPPDKPAVADGTVTGMVVVGKKPLDGGRIFFHLDGGQFVGCRLKNGKYSIDRVPAGRHLVTIEGDGVPAKYSEEKVSPIVVEIKEGANTIDLELQ